MLARTASCRVAGDSRIDVMVPSHRAFVRVGLAALCTAEVTTAAVQIFRPPSCSRGGRMDDTAVVSAVPSYGAWWIGREAPCEAELARVHSSRSQGCAFG